MFIGLMKNHTSICYHTVFHCRPTHFPDMCNIRSIRYKTGLFNIMTSEKLSFIFLVILATSTHVIMHNSNLYRDYNNHITHLLLCIYKSMPYLLNTSTD